VVPDNDDFLYKDAKQVYEKWTTQELEIQVLRRNLKNAELVLQHLAKRPENVDQTNVYWIAKIGAHVVTDGSFK
jgi:hypothetical protein